MTRKNYAYITLLRSFAVLVVVFGHACSIFNNNWGRVAQRSSVFWKSVYLFINSFQMPLFMSLSGYLFLDAVSSKLYGCRCREKIIFILNKVLRLIVPMVVIKYIWSMPIRYAIGYYGEFDDIKKLLQHYLTNTDLGHLWFLYVLFGIFVSHTLLVNVIYRNKYTKATTLILSFVAIFIAYRFPTPVMLVMKYNLYFYLGTVFHIFQKKLVSIWSFAPGKIVLVSLCCVENVLVILQDLGLVERNETRVIVASSACVVCFFLIAMECCSKKNAEFKVSEYFSTYSMGIYLFHEPILYAGLRLGYNLPAGVLILILFSSGLCLSIILTKIVRSLKLEWVIGERNR